MNGVLRVGGLCVFADGVHLAVIYIDIHSGLIMMVKMIKGESIPPGEADIIASDLIFAGFLDIHTHGREDPSQKEIDKEDAFTHGEAAINGGVVHAAEMGNNPEPPIDDESYLKKKKLFDKSSRIPVTHYAMIGRGTQPLNMRVPYKLCLTKTTGSNDVIFIPSRREIEERAHWYRGCHVSHHAEDDETLQRCKGAQYHEDQRPPEAEDSAISFALHLIENYFGKGKLCHCSVRTGIKKIVEAKMKGVDVTCEITPHHLYFDREDITDENRKWMQMNPPLRSHEDRIFCLNALRTGMIDMLATDHAPHTEEQKKKGASGQPHLDTYGPFITWLMAEQQFTPLDIHRICCANPAKFLNPFLGPEFGHGYGKLAVGYVGSLTLINRKKPIRITKDILKTKCKWSPFEGITFPGSVEATIVRGKLLKPL